MRTESNTAEMPGDSLLEELLTTSNDVSKSQFADYQKQSFQYQLECLKIEIDLVDRTIARSSNTTLNVKNFATVSWAGIVTVFLSQDKLRIFVGLTVLIPLLYWFIDAWWTSLNRGSRLRLRKISEFVNSDELLLSFKQQKFSDFKLLDIKGGQYKGTREYERTTAFRYVIWYKEIAFLYGGLMVFSILIGIIVILSN